MYAATLYKNQTHPSISFEFFPPRDAAAEANFGSVIDHLATLSPDYMSMTFGAGGSTSEGSYQSVKLMKEKKIPTVAYVAGFGLSPDEIIKVLDRYKALGIKTLFILRGDEPRGTDFVAHPDSFPHASDLLKFIHDRYDFELGCAGYPEGHIQAESLEKDIAYLKLKQDNGAQYVVTQYFYDNAFFYAYVDQCRAAGVTIPIIPGIMPIYTAKLTNMLCKLCGSTLPEGLKKQLDGLAGADAKEMAALGVDVAFEQCKDLLRHGVDGLHFYTMNRTPSVTQIIQRLTDEGLMR